MKVLSVRQPWAYALFYLGKDVENRSWSTEHRGPTAIHASQRVDPAGVRWARQVGLSLDVNALPRGVILGVVDLADVVRNHRSRWANPQVYNWAVSHPASLLDPIPWSGVLKLVDLPDEITARIVADLARQVEQGARTRTSAAPTDER